MILKAKKKKAGKKKKRKKKTSRTLRLIPLYTVKTTSKPFGKMAFGRLNMNSISYPGYPLSKGSSGEAVKHVQFRLNQINSADLIPDGIFGDKTRRAVILFQERHGLTADGIIGPKTWDELNENPQPHPYAPFYRAERTDHTYPTASHLANAIILGKLFENQAT
jgi:peptidoglycan hydrolase-like protein with peptidoglycan-binding domain